MKTSKELFDQFYKDLQSLGIDYPKDSIETKIENGYDSETGTCGLGITIPIGYHYSHLSLDGIYGQFFQHRFQGIV